MGEFNYIFDQNKLELGDILLIISDRGLSKQMEERTGCKYHHAMIVVAYSSYIHSYGGGVQSGNSARRTFEREDDVVALRLKSSSNEILINATNFVRRKIGTQYSSLRELLRAEMGLEVGAAEANRQFCSRLVAQAYAHAGVELVENPDYCTLQDLIASGEVEIISGILRIGNEDELEYAREKSPILSKQEEIQSGIFEQARVLCGTDIQTFEQLEDFLITYPEFDEGAVAIIEQSGYLYQWKEEMAKNPQYYDYDAFIASFPNEAHQAIAYKILGNYKSDLLNFSAEHSRWKASFKKHGLRYHEIHIDLIDNLIGMVVQRKEVMERILNDF
ncbi:YiiX/YebB-like N1pC/P60 family cysteine hydrolase [Pedobacter sp.]|uniref:YiiX/YebB-like N1pC/P60 family cysteine hydrolase n=1 Tax=Pedobacter sp. TaxID=1411316 RepID=UPI0031E20FA4